LAAEAHGPWRQGEDIVWTAWRHAAALFSAGLGVASQPEHNDAFLYGAGDEKIGSIVLPKASKTEQAKKGKQLKKKFLNSFPALKKLLNAVKEAAKSGSLKGLDGRKVFVRSAHAALNTLLQSAGALVCKQWLVCLEDNLQGKGLIHGWKGDYAFCAWVHDEVQIACKTQAIAEQIGQACKEAMAATAEIFNFRCPLEADFAIGKSWADTH
jgi:DNA polymerase-1